jgi:hypothetical protein
MGWTTGNHAFNSGKGKLSRPARTPNQLPSHWDAPPPHTPRRGGGGRGWRVRTTTHPHLFPWLNMSAATPPTVMCFNRVYRDVFAFRSNLYIHVWELLKLLPVFLEPSRRCCKPSERITITQLSFIFISIRTNKFTTLEARNCSLFDNNQTDSGAQPASHSVSSRNSVSWVK